MQNQEVQIKIRTQLTFSTIPPSSWSQTKFTDLRSPVSQWLELVEQRFTGVQIWIASRSGSGSCMMHTRLGVVTHSSFMRLRVVLGVMTIVVVKEVRCRAWHINLVQKRLRVKEDKGGCAHRSGSSWGVTHEGRVG